VNDGTLLHRQIHPDWVQEDRPTSQAFRPAPKDDNLLSVYDGDLISPDRAWMHYTQSMQHSSYGVCSLTVAECTSVALQARPDGALFAEHAVIDFRGVGRKDAERRAKMLRRLATDRGWQYKPPRSDDAE
jgi:hypothetical protein